MERVRDIFELEFPTYGGVKHKKHLSYASPETPSDKGIQVLLVGLNEIDLHIRRAMSPCGGDLDQIQVLSDVGLSEGPKLTVKVSPLDRFLAFGFINPWPRSDNHAVSLKALNASVMFKVSDAAGKFL